MKEFSLHREQLFDFANEIRKGAVVAYPTEAMFGLGCDPLNQFAVAKLCALKARDIAQGVVLPCAGLGHDCSMVSRMRSEIHVGTPS